MKRNEKTNIMERRTLEMKTMKNNIRKDTKQQKIKKRKKNVQVGKGTKN